MGFWAKIFSQPWTLARCSTSQSYKDSEQDLCNNDFMNSDTNVLEKAQDDYENYLPGMHQRRQRTKSGAVNEMQVNHLIEQETGLQRLRAMYSLGPDWMFIQEDTRTITTVFYRSVVLGFFLNVIQAAQSESKRSKTMSPSQLIMKGSPVTDSSTVLKRAARGSFQLTAFAASLIYLSQSIAAYRNVSSVWEYTISATVAMAVAGYGKPRRAFAYGVVGGAVAGTLGGVLICSMLSSAGASQEQRTLNRIRQRLAQQEKDTAAVS